ncbi:MAG: LptF/LptG family permease [candidate division WOR-3 bacterium]
MKKVDKYLFENLFKPFLGSVLVLTMILLLNSIFQLLDLIVKKGVSLPMVTKVVVYTLPFIVNMTFPMSFLVAALISFGKLATNNEFLALKSSGIDLKVVFLKLVVFLFFLVICNVIFNFWILPATNFRLKRVLFDIRVAKPAIQIEAGVFNKIENFLIFADKKDDKTGLLVGVKIQAITGEGVKFISAEKGKVLTSGNGSIVMELFNGEFVETRGEKREEFRRGLFKRDVVILRTSKEDFYSDVIFKGDREKSIKELLKEVREGKAELSTYSKEDKVSRYFTRRRINSILAEIHTRIALPFASIIFVLLAFPIAMRFRFSGYGSALGFSFFFFILYYILLLAGQEISRRTTFNAFLAIWLPNFAFGSIAYSLIKGELKK